MIAALVISGSVLLGAGAPSQVHAVTQKDIDNLQKVLADTKKKIEGIQQQQARTEETINTEIKSQEKLENDTKYLESVIKQNELKIQNLELEIDKLEIATNIVRKEKEMLEARLVELAAKIKALIAEQQATTNLVYKMNVSDQVFGEKMNFEQSMVNQEKTRALVTLIRANVQEVKRLEAEVTDKKNQVAEKQKSLEIIQAQKVAQSNNLTLQKQALDFQKQQKLTMIDTSKKKQAELTQKKEELADQKEALHTELGAYEQKLIQMRNSLYAMPAGGAPVAAGQVIGFQGRTGLSCNPIMPGVVRTNNYCQQYGGTGPEWYYYDPVKYPTMGSHLHFMYMNKSGVKNQTYNYLFGGVREFQHMPMDIMRLGRGYHEDFAIDLVNAHGAPVYAVKPGVVQYYCINWPPVSSFPDPAYGAIVYHYDGSKSQYWHLQRKPNSPPCKKL